MRPYPVILTQTLVRIIRKAQETGVNWNKNKEDQNIFSDKHYQETLYMNEGLEEIGMKGVVSYRYLGPIIRVSKDKTWQRIQKWVCDTKPVMLNL